MRALLSDPYFSTFLPVVVDFTKASMLYKIQTAKFFQIQPLATLAIKSEHLINELK